MEHKTENSALITLTRIFNKIENYDDNLNIGLRSLKNTACWLMIYCMADDSSKPGVLNELAEKANIKKETIVKLVSQLAKVDVIKEIISDYEKANGTFVLKAPIHLFSSYQAIAKLIDPSGYLVKHITQNQDETITLLMENHIKFLWLSKNKFEKAECLVSKKTFKGQEVDFLTADDYQHKIKYQLVNFENKSFHTVAFDVMEQAKNNQPATVYFIEPIQQSNLKPLRGQYYDIIDIMSKSSEFTKNDYEALKEAKDQFQLDGLSIKEQTSKTQVNFYFQTLNPVYTFHFIFHFPKLGKTLSTTEKRLGIYSFFEKISIAKEPIVSISYEGLRELYYDEKGGEIRNREKVSLLAGCGRPQEPEYFREDKHITIELTLSNDYMVTYAANGKSDFYPFIITDPQNNLVNVFENGDYKPYDGKEDIIPSNVFSFFSNSEENPENGDQCSVGKCILQ